MPKSFSKIWIIGILAVVLAGGFFAWQYFGASKEAKAPEVKVPEGVVQDETADWQTHKNEQYGFEIKYPVGTKMGDIDITGGREIWMQLPFSAGETNLGGKTLHIRMVTTQFNNGAEQAATCVSTAGTSYVAINGINFNKNDVSDEFGGTQSASIATEYCAMKGNEAFKLVSELIYNRYSQLPKFETIKESEIFNQIFSTFRFLPPR